MNTTKEYAYIFDYCSCNIYEIELNEETTNLDCDEFLAYYNLSINECYVMFSSKKLKIEQLTKD